MILLFKKHNDCGKTLWPLRSTGRRHFYATFQKYTLRLNKSPTK